MITRFFNRVVLTFLCCVYFLVFESCTSTRWGGSGYSLLSETEKQQVIDLTAKGDLNAMLESGAIKNGFVYEATAEQLKAAMQAHDTNVVYAWGPNCSSERCISPQIFKYHAQKNTWKPWVILEYFESKAIGEDWETPIFTVKVGAYKTNRINTYMRLFLEDLGIVKTKGNYGRFYFFSRSKFVKQVDTLTGAI